MESNATSEIERLYRQWALRLIADPPMGLDALREMFEEWHALADEPEGVSYAEAEVDGISGLWCIPAAAARDRVALYFHGGGYVVGSRHSHRKFAAHLAKAIGCVALVLDYRRAPEHRHPAPCEDGVSAFRWLLRKGLPPQHIVLAGDSAGGALATSTAVALRDQGGPLPAAILAASPFYDMELLGESLKSRANVDVLVQAPVLKGMVEMFLGEQRPTDPLANGLKADLTGLPPHMIVTGDHEVLLDDSTRFAARAADAGMTCVLDVVPRMQHVFVLAAGRLPQADEAISRMATWVRPFINL